MVDAERAEARIERLEELIERLEAVRAREMRTAPGSIGKSAT